MIKLTNATAQFDGEPILLNPDFIVSIYSVIDENNDEDVISHVTMIYTSLQQSWVVKETVEEIHRMISGGKSK